ncbi:MAG: polysulfide reductase NrfD, partial [Chloroflexota bacterium]|nr:polysulfide reductase NrfD [Chloroflexota bacterium]
TANAQVGRPMPSAAGPAARYVVFAVWLLAAIVGGYAIAQRLLLGERLTAYSSYIPWGLWVAAYIFFIGLSAGAFLLSSVVYVFGIRRFERIGPLALFVAIVTLAMALLSILFDLGHMERFWEVYVRPQVRSMMAWMVWLYTIYFVLLIVELAIALRRRTAGRSPAQLKRDDRILLVLGSIGVPLAVAFHGGVGALFATLVAREYWNTALFPILFLSGALLSGSALLLAIVVFLWPRRDAVWRGVVGDLARIVVGLVLLELLIEFAEFTVPAWYQVGPQSSLIGYVLFGPYWYVFWAVYGVFGVVVPLVLLTRRDPFLQGLGAALVALTFFAVRLNLVIPGLVTPELRGLERAYLDPVGGRLSYAYFPSLFEWQVTLGVVAIGVALYYLGQRVLPLTTGEDRPKESAG